MGRTSPERAINFIATNPYGFKRAFSEVAKSENLKLKLHTIAVERSLVRRPGRDCWNVRLQYFDNTAQTDTYRKVYRLTVDVSDVVPVIVEGSLRHWSIAG